MATPDDHLLAAQVAAEAGELLRELRAELTARRASGEELKAAGDRHSHELIMGRLTQARPGDAVLSEEGKDDLARLGAPRCWIIDPLDGTREFGEPPRHDWAVHVALVEAGVPTAAAVAIPALDRVFTAAAPESAPAAHQGPPRVVASRTRPGPAAQHLVEHLGGEMVYLGSAGYKAMSVLLGEADIYAHTGGQYEWDSCAPVGVILAAGLHASRLDGTPLRYNNADTYLPDLLICRPEWAARCLEELHG
jgi:3'(2'), 5'-bisphosphate nucleotidase